LFDVACVVAAYAVELDARADEMSWKDHMMCGDILILEPKSVGSANRVVVRVIDAGSTYSLALTSVAGCSVFIDCAAIYP
jgi:hypothetical protein